MACAALLYKILLHPYNIRVSFCFSVDMIDIKDLRERPDYYRDSTSAKNGDAALVDTVLRLDEERRRLISERDEKKGQQNTLSKQIPQTDAGERDKLVAESKALGDQVKEMDARLTLVEEEYTNAICQIPNPIHESVPKGASDAENIVARQEGEKPAFNFPAKEHWELGEELNILDLERGAKVSGSRFVYLKNDLVMLEFALISFVLQKLYSKGFTPMIPPYMVRERAMYGTGFFPADRSEIYHVNPEEDDLYLIGTSEVSLVNYYDNEVIDVSKPQRFVGYSPCFRREAGSYGKDMKGLIRVHQFEKVEMVSFCHPDKSWEEHEFLRSIEEEILSDLAIPYQVLNICSGDLGGSAAKKYDLEAWLPGQQQYREMTSTSNTTDFQARRLNIRFRNDEGAMQFVHILNGTATSMRPLIAIMENYQQEDGTIMIPKVLQPFMGKERITKA